MELLHLYISPAHNFVGHHGKEPGSEPMTDMDQVECVAGRGLKGDRYFDFKDDYKGQVTFFAHEAFEQLCEKLGEYGLTPEVLRRNIVTKGLDLNALIGKEFEIQGVRFLGIEESKPCYWMNRAFGEGAEAALRGHGGLRAKILNNGMLKRGACQASLS